ncbi:acyltransferase family protein [Pseudomonas sp. NW5]|uniref:acyltransferase family protein n=1 Tax=Pseudomonas sp. NW5 TaxID=2934934 RepID=UPI0020209948|nr:acyltransferase family protein [Pseudomonas sp. NW5]MCL7461844.1 acyltransferase [Pseudomonas sp. NW5]
MAASNMFRADINGLRAWAVAAVVLYHFGVPGLGGGFAGVDVFFVISGFLMAGIVERGLAQGNFSLARFYAARAARIWPALLVVCLSVLALGWFLLVDSEYNRLGKHVRDSLLFSSNLRYADEAGYFDSASHGKWLLHTWSLSVEWQFYLVFPLAYLLLRRLLGVERLKRLLPLLTLALLLVSVWMVQRMPTEAFFTLQSRAWEMLVGALVFLYVPRMAWRTGVARLLHYAGFVLIAVSFALVDELAQWPGWPALLPVLGAALVIAAAQPGVLVSGRLWQWLGDKSYSIYLWHWPVMVLLHFFERAGQGLWVLGGIALSLLLGGLSYRLIEQPARRWLSALPPWRVLLVCLLVIGLAAGLAQYVRKHTFTSRLPAQAEHYARQADNHDPRLFECLRDKEACRYGEGPTDLLVLGDSHAASVITAVAASREAGRSVLLRARSACLMVFGAQRSGSSAAACAALQGWAMNELSTLDPQIPLLLVNRTSSYAFGGMPGEAGEPAGRPTFFFSRPYRTPEPAYLQEFRRHYLDTLCTLARQRPVYVLQPMPEMLLNVPEAMARDAIIGRQRELFLPLDAYQQRHAFIRDLQQEAARQCGIKLLDPLPYLCPEGRCLAVQEGRALYYDDDHLSEFGNRLLVPLFRSIPTGIPH